MVLLTFILSKPLSGKSTCFICRREIDRETGVELVSINGSVTLCKDCLDRIRPIIGAVLLGSKHLARFRAADSKAFNEAISVLKELGLLTERQVP